MVFLLVPVEVEGVAADAPQPATRRFQRARYFPAPDARTQLEGLSEHRKKVLQEVVRHPRPGVLAREVIARTGLPHGSVQQALHWLQDHGLVEAKEDS